MFKDRKRMVVDGLVGMVVSLLILVLFAASAGAEDGAGSVQLPMKLQQAILFKCTPYAAGIISRAKEEFKVGILYNEETLVIKNEFEETFSENFQKKNINKLPVKLIFIDETNFDFLSLDSSKDYLQTKDDFPAVNVLYIISTLREEQIKAILEMTAEKKCMTVTSVQSNADAGISLGILLNQKTQKPRILIHLKTAQAEDCQFNPALFRLAEVIK
jgi:hypothetical protein